MFVLLEIFHSKVEVMCYRKEDKICWLWADVTWTRRNAVSCQTFCWKHRRVLTKPTFEFSFIFHFGFNSVSLQTGLLIYLWFFLMRRFDCALHEDILLIWNKSWSNDQRWQWNVQRIQLSNQKCELSTPKLIRATTQEIFFKIVVTFQCYRCELLYSQTY